MSAGGAGIGGVFESLSGGKGAILAALTVLIVLFVLVELVRGHRPAYRRGRFLSANEKRFLNILDEAVGADYRVFAQVRLADLVDVDARASEARRRAAMRKVFGKSVDFVICTSRGLDPVAAVEVDDSTHWLAHRRERDALVDAVFKEIGVPLVRVKARGNYSLAVLRAMLGEVGIERRWAPRAGLDLTRATAGK